MRIFQILSGPYKGKHIRVPQYEKTAAGVEIYIDHNVPAVGKDLQWVQTVSSNHGYSVACKMLTRVDPFGHGDPDVHKVSIPSMPGICKADDLKPFYWTAADLAGGAGLGLYDAPQVPAPSSGRTWTKFVTALTEVKGKTVHHLVAIAWGYDRMADGSVRVAAIRKPHVDEIRNHGLALKRMYPDYKYT